MSSTGVSEAGFEASAFRMAEDEMCRALGAKEVFRA